MDPVFLDTLEKKYGVEPGLLNAIMMQESGGKANAVSPKGAMGWFQFMPGTAQQYGVKDPTDFYQSAEGAAKYLSTLYKRYNDWDDALRAYNWGEGNLDKFKKGVRKDMPKETANYVPSVRKRQGKAMDDDLPPDLDDLPPDLDDLPPDVDDVPARAGTPDDIPDQKYTAPPTQEEAAALAPATRDWQKELENAPGTTVLPAVAGTLGAAAGGTIAAPTVVGTVGGAAAGGLSGAMLGHIAAIARSDAPIEEKLKYLAKQSGIEALLAATGAKGAQVLSSMLAKTPADKIAIEQWFRQQGSATKPLLSERLNPRATSVYRAAEKEQKGVVDNAINEALSSLNRGQSPTAAGTTYQEGYKLARKAVDDQHEKLFAPFTHGTTFGATMVSPTAEAVTIAKKALQYIADAKSSNKGATVGPDIEGILKDVAAGKRVPLATLHTQKRALADSANWESMGGTVDNMVRKKLSGALDGSIEAGLPANARADWQKANRIASGNLELLNSSYIKKLASDEKVDPMELAEFVGKNASPATIQEFKRSMGLMLKTGAMRSDQAGVVMDHVRRNWIEQNMGNHTKAADVWKSVLGKGGDAETADAFNAVFQNSPMRATMVGVAKAAHALEQFGGRIPAHGGQPGQYMMAGAAGSMAGGPVGGALGVAGTFLYNWIPKLVASNRLAQDGRLANKVRMVTGWIQNQPEAAKEFAKVGASAMPAAVYRAYMDIANAATEGEGE